MLSIQDRISKNYIWFSCFGIAKGYILSGVWIKCSALVKKNRQFNQFLSRVKKLNRKQNKKITHRNHRIDMIFDPKCYFLKRF